MALCMVETPTFVPAARETHERAGVRNPAIDFLDESTSCATFVLGGMYWMGFEPTYSPL